MTRARRVAALALLSAALIATPAAACVWTVSGPLPSARERAQIAKQNAAARLARINADVRARRVDVAVGLADMLIPNVRAVPIWQSSCGDTNEYDTLGGAKTPWDGSEFDGTELEGLDPETNGAYYRELGFDTNACNVEFRGRFAVLLRVRVQPKLLDRAYVILAFARGDGSHFRYYDFTGSRREPPVKLHGDFTYARVHRTPMWKVLDPVSPVGSTVAEFWASVGSRMADTDFVCPQTRAAFVTGRDAWMIELRKRPNYPQILRQAAASRAARKQPVPTEKGS